MQTGFMAPARNFNEEGLGTAQAGVAAQHLTPMKRQSQRAGEAGQLLGHLIAELEKRLSPILLPDRPAADNGQVVDPKEHSEGSMLSEFLRQHASLLEHHGTRLRSIIDRLTL